MNGGSVRIDDFIKGEVTQYQIIRISPFGGEIALVAMKGNILIRALNQGEKNVGTGAYLQKARISKNTDGRWTINSQPIDGNTTYKIAISSYLVDVGDTHLEFLAEDQNVIKLDVPRVDFYTAITREFKLHYPSETTQETK